MSIIPDSLGFNFLREGNEELFVFSELLTLLQHTRSSSLVTTSTTHRCTHIPLCGWLWVRTKAATFVCLCLQGRCRCLHLRWCWSCRYHHWKRRALCSCSNIDGSISGARDVFMGMHKASVKPKPSGAAAPVQLALHHSVQNHTPQALVKRPNPVPTLKSLERNYQPEGHKDIR